MNSSRQFELKELKKRQDAAEDAERQRLQAEADAKAAAEAEAEAARKAEAASRDAADAPGSPHSSRDHEAGKWSALLRANAQPSHHHIPYFSIAAPRANPPPSPLYVHSNNPSPTASSPISPWKLLIIYLTSFCFDPPNLTLHIFLSLSHKHAAHATQSRMCVCLCLCAPLTSNSIGRRLAN